MLGKVCLALSLGYLHNHTYFGFQPSQLTNSESMHFRVDDHNFQTRGRHRVFSKTKYNSCTNVILGLISPQTTFLFFKVKM